MSCYLFGHSDKAVNLQINEQAIKSSLAYWIKTAVFICCTSWVSYTGPVRLWSDWQFAPGKCGSVLSVSEPANPVKKDCSLFKQCLQKAQKTAEQRGAACSQKTVVQQGVPPCHSAFFFFCSFHEGTESRGLKWLRVHLNHFLLHPWTTMKHSQSLWKFVAVNLSWTSVPEPQTGLWFGSCRSLVSIPKVPPKGWGSLL